MTEEAPSKQQAVEASVQEARRVAHWVQGLIGGGLGLGFLALLFTHGWHHFSGGWFWIFKGAAALGAGLGVRAGARRARREVRQLPDTEAVELLRPLAEHPDETTRRVAQSLMKGLHPEGTEVVPAREAEGRGTEVTPSSNGGPSPPNPCAS